MVKKKETLMDAAKETVGLGLVSGVGMYGVGALGSLAGPQAAPVTRAVGGGLALVNVGRMAKTGMLLADTMKESMPVKKKAKPKTFAEDRISRILG